MMEMPHRFGSLEEELEVLKQLSRFLGFGDGMSVCRWNGEGLGMMNALEAHCLIVRDEKELSHAAGRLLGAPMC